MRRGEIRPVFNDPSLARALYCQPNDGPRRFVAFAASYPLPQQLHGKPLAGILCSIQQEREPEERDPSRRQGAQRQQASGHAFKQ
jgi:hypothetical protein